MLGGSGGGGNPDRARGIHGVNFGFVNDTTRRALVEKTDGGDEIIAQVGKRQLLQAAINACKNLVAEENYKT